MNVDQNFPPMTEEEKQRVINNWGRQAEIDKAPSIKDLTKNIPELIKEESPVLVKINAQDRARVKDATETLNKAIEQYNKLVLPEKRMVIHVPVEHPTLSDAINFLTNAKKELQFIRNYIARHAAVQKEQQAKLDELLKDFKC